MEFKDVYEERMIPFSDLKNRPIWQGANTLLITDITVPKRVDIRIM
jgi:hypothetical protein